MPDDNDDQHVVLNFQPRSRSQPKSPQRGRQPGPQADLEDIVASGAVILALVAPIAIGSGWVPASRYTLGIRAWLAVLAGAAKNIRATRSQSTVWDPAREHR